MVLSPTSNRQIPSWSTHPRDERTVVPAGSEITAREAWLSRRAPLRASQRFVDFLGPGNELEGGCRSRHARPPAHTLGPPEVRVVLSERDRSASVRPFAERHIRQGPKVERLHRTREHAGHDEGAFIRQAVDRLLALHLVHEESPEDEVKPHEDEGNPPEREDERGAGADDRILPEQSKASPEKTERDQEGVRWPENQAGTGCPGAEHAFLGPELSMDDRARLDGSREWHACRHSSGMLRLSQHSAVEVAGRRTKMTGASERSAVALGILVEHLLAVAAAEVHGPSRELRAELRR